MKEENMNKKRVIIATVFGIVMGLICFLGGKYGLKDDITTAEFIYIMTNRTLIGFVIGISALRIHWAFHGSLLGLIVGLPFASGCLLEPDNMETAIAALILGVVYGFLIELFTTVIFRARVIHPTSAEQTI